MQSKGRDSIYIAVEHARRRDVFSDPKEIARRSTLVATDRSLVEIFAHEEERCKKLRELQTKHNVVVFQDIFGTQYKFTQAYKRLGTDVEAYFSLFPSARQLHSDVAVTKNHEDAVKFASQLALENKLRVFTTCSFSNHQQAPEVATGWVPTDMKHKCVRAIQVDGSGEGRTVAIAYKWVPDPLSDDFFVLDAAVLNEGRLQTAIEIEYSHANSSKKRQAFETHGITSVQIRASDLNNVCRVAGWCASKSGVVVVADHPVTARNLWFCAPCEAAEKEQSERLHADAVQRQQEQDKRDAYEKELLTTFDNPERGKWLKGFLHVNDPKNENASNRLVYLNESKYDYKNNPRPNNLKLVVFKGHADCLKAMEDGAVCFKVTKELEEDCFTPKKLLLRIKKGDTYNICRGLDLPGFDANSAPHGTDEPDDGRAGDPELERQARAAAKRQARAEERKRWARAEQSRIEARARLQATRNRERQELEQRRLQEEEAERKKKKQQEEIHLERLAALKRQELETRRLQEEAERKEAEEMENEKLAKRARLEDTSAAHQRRRDEVASRLAISATPGYRRTVSMGVR